MPLQNQCIEIGCLREQVGELEAKQIGQVFPREKCRVYQKECLMRQMFHYLQEIIIIEKLIAIFMD